MQKPLQPKTPQTAKEKHEKILNQYAQKPISPYNQEGQADKFFFVSGQFASNPKKGKIIAKDITAQTYQVIENIKAILGTAGCNPKDVVQSTAYLSSMTLFDGFNQEYAKYFEGEYPDRATVGDGLKTGALVEVSVVAYKD